MSIKSLFIQHILLVGLNVISDGHFSPACWILICFFSPLYQAYDAEQMEQEYNLIPVWVTMCFRRDSLAKNDFSHSLHCKDLYEIKSTYNSSFSTWCVRILWWIFLICFCILLAVENFHWQNLQEYGWTRVWVRKCIRRLLFVLPRYEQFGHLKFLTSECVRQWLASWLVVLKHFPHV